VYKYLTGGSKEDRAKLLPVIPSERIRGNGHRPQFRKLSLNMRNCIFTVRMTGDWKTLYRPIGESQSLEIFKT